MARRIKIPKRIAGVKIPKPIRKGPLVDFLNSTAGQVVLAQSIVAVGGLIGWKASDTDSGAGSALRHPVDALRATGESLTQRSNATAAKLTRAFAAAAHAFREVMEKPDSADLTPAGHGAEAAATPQVPTAEVMRDQALEADAQATEESGRKKSRVRSDAPSIPH